MNRFMEGGETQHRINNHNTPEMFKYQRQDFFTAEGNIYFSTAVASSTREGRGTRKEVCIESGQSSQCSN
jgi:hypothetical protein